ncbi:MAG: GWxTD domain-containing protein, partial [Bacteroidota bacterium]
MRLLLSSLLAGLALVLAGTATAQTTPDTFEEDAFEDAAYEALIAIGNEDWATATARLQPIVAADPTYLSTTLEGSAAYWLGHAHAAQDRSAAAHVTWKRGLLALNARGLFDAQLAEAFVRSTFAGSHTDDEDLASRTFLAVLEALDTLPGSDLYPLLEPHLVGLQVIVPEAMRAEVGLDAWIEERGTSSLAPETGARLSAWWRGQDLSPATPLNERLLEHLRRVAYAQRQYDLDEGVDERGPVYVRLGDPTKVTEVQFDRGRFLAKVIDPNPNIRLSDFYANEFWYYDHLGPDAQFLFVNKDGAFKQGTVRDLLPPALRSGIGPSLRGLNKAVATARTLEEIYLQLSLHDSDYASRYVEMSSFVGLLDEGSPRVPGTSLSSDRPDLFVLSALAQGVVEDDQLTLRQEENTPDSFSNEFDDAEPLPATVRHARFLDPDGTTRTELYWGVPPGGLEPSRRMRQDVRRVGYNAEDYLMVATLSQRNAAYQARTIEQRRHVLPDIGSTPEASLAPLTYTLAGDTSLYHVAVQFEQYAARLDRDGTPLSTGPRVLVNT